MQGYRTHSRKAALYDGTVVVTAAAAVVELEPPIVVDIEDDLLMPAAADGLLGVDSCLTRHFSESVTVKTLRLQVAKLWS